MQICGEYRINIGILLSVFSIFFGISDTKLGISISKYPISVPVFGIAYHAKFHVPIMHRFKDFYIITLETLGVHYCRLRIRHIHEIIIMVLNTSDYRLCSLIHLFGFIVHLCADCIQV